MFLCNEIKTKNRCETVWSLRYVWYEQQKKLNVLELQWCYLEVKGDADMTFCLCATMKC